MAKYFLIGQSFSRGQSNQNNYMITIDKIARLIPYQKCFLRARLRN